MEGEYKMVIDKESIKASYTKNGTTTTIKLAPYLTKANYGFNKEWDAEAGRNLAKSVQGSFDIFPKIICYFKPLNKTELDTLAPLFNSKVQSFTYYDPELHANKTINTYTGNWAYDCMKVNLAEPFNLSFIARDRRV